MITIHNEREAFIFGQQQIGLIPERFRQAFLKGARDKAYVEAYVEGCQNILDPEVEEAYEALLSAYRTKAAVAEAVGICPSNLQKYVTGRASIGPKVKTKFLAAAGQFHKE